MTQLDQPLSAYLEEVAARVSSGRVAFIVSYQGDSFFISAAVIGTWGNTSETVNQSRKVYSRVFANPTLIPDHPYLDYDRVEFWERGVLVETLLRQSAS